MNNDDLKNVLKEINYKKYEDLFKDYAEQKVTIGLSNNACRQITQTEKTCICCFWIIYWNYTINYNNYIFCYY